MKRTIFDEIQSQLDAKGMMILPSAHEHVILHPADQAVPPSYTERSATSDDDDNLGNELAQLLDGTYNGPCTRCGNSGECPITGAPCPKGCGGGEAINATAEEMDAVLAKHGIDMRRNSPPHSSSLNTFFRTLRRHKKKARRLGLDVLVANIRVLESSAREFDEWEEFEWRVGGVVELLGSCQSALRTKQLPRDGLLQLARSMTEISRLQFGWTCVLAACKKLLAAWNECKR